jgi:hypothetical protein
MSRCGRKIDILHTAIVRPFVRGVAVEGRGGGDGGVRQTSWDALLQCCCARPSKIREAGDSFRSGLDAKSHLSIRGCVYDIGCGIIGRVALYRAGSHAKGGIARVRRDVGAVGFYEPRKRLAVSDVPGGQRQLNS